MEPNPDVSKHDHIDKNDPVSAADFNTIATQIFAPVYPVIADMALGRCGISSGLCLDLGCGPGLLAIAMARATNMQIIALDHSPPMLAHARDNIKAAGLGQRIKIREGDVHSLPLAPNSVDLVVSRGSVLFWQDKVKAFAEIRRVLKTSGKAFVGCGMGSPDLKKQIFEQMQKIDSTWEESHKDRSRQQSPTILEQAARAAGFTEFEVTADDRGIWVYLVP
jgi:ubiquinone/menaquinone biosynthesis C-methylase UbiE